MTVTIPDSLPSPDIGFLTSGSQWAAGLAALKAAGVEP